MFRTRRVVHLLAPSLLLALLSACGAMPAATPATKAVAVATTLNVFAAASLTEAFGEIGTTFEAQNPGVTVAYNFAGSNQLAQQITEGAPADVFASANKRQMDVVVEAGQVISGAQRTFVHNRLVVIYPNENPAGIQTLQDLGKRGIKLVLAPKDVPVGQYALDFLAKASASPEYTTAFSETVTANVVSYEENVRAILTKVALGEADAGIVYTSDVAGEAASTIGRIDIPDEFNTITDYPIAPIKDAPNAELAQRFADYILSPATQRVLVKYGFIPSNRRTN